MTEERHRDEKEEKEEKDEKGRQEKGGGGMEEKWRRDPLSGIFFGLLVIGVGIIFLLASRDYIDWADWWAYLLLVIGCVFILEGLVRAVMPAYRRPYFGKLIAGIVLIAIGATNIFYIGAWWPFIIIGVGLVILLSQLFRMKKPRE